MKTTTKLQLLKFIEEKSQATPAELRQFLQLSSQAIHRHLKNLVGEGSITKIGSPPHVYYIVAKKAAVDLFKASDVEKSICDFMDRHYLYIDPQGHIKKGLIGFCSWLVSTKQQKQAMPLLQEFQKIRSEAFEFFSNDHLMIDATKKFEQTFEALALSKVFYSDFYSLPKFGKTPLGTQVLYAKQAQNTAMIREVAQLCRASILKILEKEEIQAIVWTPHSLPRKIPFLKELRQALAFSLPEIVFLKAYAGDIPIPQKSLSKLEERIENATNTIFPKKNNIDVKRILIIDDAVGSGATLHAIAQKIKTMRPESHIVGYAIVGSYKGFEVIKEV